MSTVPRTINQPTVAGAVAMPSLHSRVLGTALRTAVRPMMNALPVHPLTIPFGRRFVDATMPALIPAGKAKIRRVKTSYEGRPVRGEWVRGGEGLREDAAILYLHGGAFVLCSPRTHRGLVAQLSARSKLPAFSVEYRLAPKYRAPSAADDALNAYRWMLANGYRPQDIVIAGDSAGGQLALGLAAALRRAQLPQPAGVVLFSPYLDLTGALATELDARIRDPYVTARLLHKVAKFYSEMDDQSQLLLRTDLSGLAPILVQAGGAEMLADDARTLAALVRDAGGACTLQLWPGQIHVFQALYRFLPESRAALAQAGAFAARAVETRGARRLAAVS